MSIVFLVGACVLVIAFVLSIMMKEVPLRQMSGIEQARADVAAATAAAAANQDGHAAAGPDGVVVASVGRSAADGVSSADGAVPAARPPGGR